MTFTLPTLANIHDATLTQALQHALDNKTKPQGSLGRMEGLALQIGQILGTQQAGARAAANGGVCR